MSIEIISGDLLLRPWQPVDADAVYRACQDPEIRRWTTLPTPYLPEHAEHLVAGLSPQSWADGTGAPLGVFDRHTGELLGSSGLVRVDRAGRAGELGYWTAPWARGRGVALAAARATAAYAFDRLDLTRVTWAAELGNWASRLVAERAGFRIEGESRLYRPHPQGRPESWTGALYPGELCTGTPPRYAPGSRYARRAAVFGRPQPTLPGLRPMCAADVDPATAACQDPESARWTTVPVPYTRADAESFIFDHAPLSWAAGRGAVFTIESGGGEFAGSIDVRIGDRDTGTAEIGFLVAPWARGRGLATAAARTLADWALTTLDLDRLVWRAHLGNEASRRVAEKAGFRFEGVERAGCEQRGERRDAWLAARLPGG